MRFFIITFGCQTNEYDSMRIADLLLNMQYTQTDKPEEADVIVVNTCHIREKAELKVFSMIGRYRILKQSNPSLQIVITGCMAQAYGHKLFKYGADIILGPQSYHELTRKLGTKSVLKEFTASKKFDFLPQVQSHNTISSFVSIQEGCNKFCTYCVVPFVRGPEYSRLSTQIYKEVERLMTFGVKEIILLGQNVNAYCDTYGTTLSDLIINISKLGIERISYTSSHPSNITDQLIETHKLNALLPHLQFAVQSGSNKILKLMNRSHTVEEYINIVDRLKQVRPDMTFSTDIIIGFPGETEEDFEMTLDLIRYVKFIQIYYFIYSPRKGTPAYKMLDETPYEVKKVRLAKLKQLLSIYQQAYNTSLINSYTSVLIENKKQHTNEYFGRNNHLQPVHIVNNTYDLSIGQIYNVQVQKVFLRGLEGTIHPQQALYS